MNEEEKRLLEELKLQRNAFTHHNGFELEAIGTDKAVYRLDIHAESLNPYGLVHGGALYTLADDAVGAAVHSDGRHYVTQNGALHFLKNQNRGTIRATATIRHRGKKICLAAVDITNEAGDLLATGEFTYFCVDKALMDQRAK